MQLVDKRREGLKLHTLSGMMAGIVLGGLSTFIGSPKSFRGHGHGHDHAKRARNKARRQAIRRSRKMSRG